MTSQIFNWRVIAIVVLLSGCFGCYSASTSSNGGGRPTTEGIEIWDDYESGNEYYRIANCGIFNTSRTPGYIPSIRITFNMDVQPGNYCVFIDDGCDLLPDDDWVNITSDFQIVAPNTLECTVNTAVDVGSHRIVARPDGTHPTDPYLAGGDDNMMAVADFLIYESIDDLLGGTLEDGTVEVDFGGGNIALAERNFLSLTPYDGILQDPANDAELSSYLRLWNLRPVGQIRGLDILMVRTANMSGNELLNLAEELSEDDTDGLIFFAGLNWIGKHAGASWEEMPTGIKEAFDDESGAFSGCHERSRVGSKEPPEAASHKKVKTPENVEKQTGPSFDGEKCLNSNEQKEPTIDFQEVDRLIKLLDNKDHKVRARAKETLTSMSEISIHHKEALAQYLFEKSKEVSSLEVRARVAAILEDLTPLNAKVVTVYSEGAYSHEDSHPLCKVLLADNELDLRHAISPYPRYRHLRSSLMIGCKSDFALFCKIGLLGDTNHKIHIVSARRDFASSRTLVRLKVMPPRGGQGAGSAGSSYICGIIVMEPTTLPITVVLEDPENVFRMGEIEEKERKLLTTEITIDGNPLEGKRLVVGEQSVKELIKLLEHKNFFVRRDAVRALGKLGTPEAIAAVIEHFGSEKNELVKRWAVIVLGRSGAKNAIPALKAEFNPKSKRGAFTLSTDIFWALIKLEAEGIESAGAFGGYVKRFIYHLSHEYRKVDYKSLSDEERMAFLKRAADEFEARYLKETPDIPKEE